MGLEGVQEGGSLIGGPEEGIPTEWGPPDGSRRWSPEGGYNEIFKNL